MTRMWGETQHPPTRVPPPVSPHLSETVPGARTYSGCCSGVDRTAPTVRAAWGRGQGMLSPSEGWDKGLLNAGTKGETGPDPPAGGWVAARVSAPALGSGAGSEGRDGTGTWAVRGGHGSASPEPRTGGTAAALLPLAPAGMFWQSAGVPGAIGDSPLLPSPGLRRNLQQSRVGYKTSLL